MPLFKRSAALLAGVVLVAALAVYGYPTLSHKHATPVYGAAATAPAPTPSPPDLAPRAPEFQSGVAVYIGGVDQGPSLIGRSRRFFDATSRLGVNSVSIIFPIYTNDLRSSTVYADQRTPNHEALSTVVQEAHRHHLFVTLRPLLDEASLTGPGEWRGILAPADIGAWFQSYGDLVLGYASFAEENRIESLDVGSEFESIQPYTQAWQALIASVRRVYRGQVTYSLNFTSLQFRIPFALDLDYLSVDAYFPLDAPPVASVGELETAWQPWVASLADLKTRAGRPIILSEIGVPSEVGAHRQPWLLDRAGTVSLEEQSRYYRAACQSLGDQVGGMYWWLFDLNSPQASGTDVSFDPMNKPAAREIANCFRTASPARGATSLRDPSVQPQT